MTYLRAKSAAAVGADCRHDDDEKTAATTGPPPPPPPAPPPTTVAQPKRPPPPPVLLLQKYIIRWSYEYIRRGRRRAQLLVPRPPASTRQRPRSFGLVCQSPRRSPVRGYCRRDNICKPFHIGLIFAVPTRL